MNLCDSGSQTLIMSVLLSSRSWWWKMIQSQRSATLEIEGGLLSVKHSLAQPEVTYVKVVFII